MTAFTLPTFRLKIFEAFRFDIYLQLTVKLVIRLESYMTIIILNFKKAKNNPDNILCDEKTFIEITNSKLINYIKQ